MTILCAAITAISSKEGREGVNIALMQNFSDDFFVKFWDFEGSNMPKLECFRKSDFCDALKKVPLKFCINSLQRQI